LIRLTRTSTAEKPASVARRFSSSPVAAGGKLYFASEEGEVYVIKAGPVFELLSTNTMGEVTMATPAVDNSVLYYRTRGHVVAIA